jgi:hypothetical protein
LDFGQLPATVLCHFYKVRVRVQVQFLKMQNEGRGSRKPGLIRLLFFYGGFFNGA